MIDHVLGSKFPSVHMPMMASQLKDEVLENKEKPLYFEPIIGWRAWNIYVDPKRGRVRLQSITYKLLWPPGSPFRARCNTKQNLRHEAPNLVHKCGIYSVKNEDDAARWMNYQRSNSNCIRGIGEVKLWGNIYKFTRGYVAEYAYPASVHIDHDIPSKFDIDIREIVKLMRRTYRGVKVNTL